MGGMYRSLVPSDLGKILRQSRSIFIRSPLPPHLSANAVAENLCSLLPMTNVCVSF